MLVHVRFVGGDIVRGQQDGLAGEAGFDGVEGGFGAAFGSDGAGAFLSVGAIGGALGVGDGTRLSGMSVVSSGAKSTFGQMGLGAEAAPAAAAMVSGWA